MGRNILVPIDESKQSTRALEFVLEEHPDSRITVVHVINPDDIFQSPGIESSRMASYEQIRQHHEQRAESLLETARKQADDEGVEIETDYLTGKVSKAIIDYADEHDIDHIVLGSHGRTGARRILLGSVAEKIARRSPVPVTIVR
jgi:nucleotide-binding universal stress UspA family protein